MRKLLYTLIIATTLWSCGGGNSGTSEGVIEYKISYPDVKKSSFMADFMPRTMVMKFKDGTYTTNLSAGMGMFKSQFICDKDDDSFIQKVKLINKKYALKLEGDHISTSLKNRPQLSVKLTDESKKILGYDCKKATITVKGDTSDFDFNVFYTDQIDIETPNWCTEFAGIDGVLLEYQYKKYDIVMKFTAKKITFQEISDEEFVLEEDYELISEEEMENEMYEIFKSFN